MSREDLRLVVDLSDGDVVLHPESGTAVTVQDLLFGGIRLYMPGEIVGDPQGALTHATSFGKAEWVTYVRHLSHGDRAV